MATKSRDLNGLLVKTQTTIFRNVDYLPVSLWGFDETALDLLKKQKHAAVNKKLSKKQQNKLDNDKKQKIAQRLGAVPQTVSEIYKVLAHSKLANKMPSRPNVKLIKKTDPDETKENQDAPELDSSVLEILKKKGVGKRPYVRNAINAEDKNDDDEELNEDGTPFKKARKQHMPLTEEDKEKRREKRKEGRKQRASQAKAARNEGAKEQKAEVKEDGDAEDDTEPEKNALSFSKLDFVIKDNKAPTKKEKREKLSGRDYASLQKKVEKRNEMVERIRTKNPEKAQGLEERIKWDTAMKRAEGKKVKDDLDMLSKAAKRKEKVKDKRKKVWGERVEKVEQDKKKKQEKRETNIAKRREEKVAKKLQRARKKGRNV